MIPVELLTAVEAAQPFIVAKAVCIKTNELVAHVLVILLPALYFCVFGHQSTINITSLKPYFFAFDCIFILYAEINGNTITTLLSPRTPFRPAPFLPDLHSSP